MNVDNIDNFVKQWQGHGYEMGESNKFWLQLLREVIGLENVEQLINFEVPVPHGRIDALIASKKVLIEQKSSLIPLDDAVFNQAKTYNDNLEYSRRARWIVLCNFAQFKIYDTDKPKQPPVELMLNDLPKKYYLLDFLIDERQHDLRVKRDLSIEASKRIGKLYDALRDTYADKNCLETLQSLNKLCVRLVFLLYIDNTELFGRREMFRTWIDKSLRVRRELIDLFEVLNTPLDNRNSYDDDLNQFPFVNGGLFKDIIEIPKITGDIKTMIVNELVHFEWDNISPTIFGTIFESTINPDARGEAGIHYTAPDNILKVINSLFMNDFRAEFNAANSIDKLTALHNKIASIKIFDPACGSGNFLTESFIQLRKLENDIIDALKLKGVKVKSKISISQFYGIEINSFAVAIAMTALWISKLQMHNDDESPFPLKDAPNITCGNALTTDWNTIISPHDCTYIISNPPFAGYSSQTKDQKAEMLKIYSDKNGKPYRKAGKIDYVAGWYFKAAEFLQGNDIRCAFLSTNSICQGEQVCDVWKVLVDRFNIHIDFAYQTFKWDSESDNRAQVNCVIIGFSVAENDKPKILFDSNGNSDTVKHINFYLMAANDVFIDSRVNPICDVPKMTTGNRPADGGNLIIEAKDYDDFVKNEPLALKYIKRLIGSEEFINGKARYCLWLVDCPPDELRSMKLVMKRVKACRADRLKGAPDRQKLAETPTLFRETNNPKSAIVVPEVSGESRKYIPIGFIDDSVICTNKLKLIPNGSIYLFGILTSIVHMAWTRVVCGRLGVSYDYSNKIVYNNFPFVKVNSKQKAAIEATAQTILDVRARYAKATLADLYGVESMPKDLLEAHKANDKAVLKAYGFSARMSEAEIVARLFEMRAALLK